MQKVEKVFKQQTARQHIIFGDRCICRQLAKAALILYVPFCIESVHALLSRIV
jgi:hypothetical protein